MTEYSRTAKGKFTSTGAAQAIYLPFQPDYVSLINYTASAAFTDHRVLSAQWDINMGQGFAITQVKNTTYQTDSVITNGISTFSAGQMLQFGARQQIIGATAANPIVFNVTAHGYAVGDVVMFEGLYQSSTTGMAQIDGIPFRVSAVGDADHFSVVWPGSASNYTALSGSPAGAFVMKILYPFLYAPGVAYLEAITTGTTTTIVTTAPHNFVVGQEVAFRIPQSWGTTQLNSLPNNTTPGSPIYAYVISVTDATTFVVNVNSTGYTAFNTNQTIASVPGLSFPQVLAVGDVNTGGVAISSGSALYPPPYTVFTGTTRVNSINGPAINGAFFNNTRSGFIIGAGTCVTDTSAVLVGATSDVIYWEAFLHDLSIP
jgi:hypothetical protein